MNAAVARQMFSRFSIFIALLITVWLYKNGGNVFHRVTRHTRGPKLPDQSWSCDHVHVFPVIFSPAEASVIKRSGLSQG